MRLTKEQWARHVEAWRSSGTSAAKYCASRDLKASSLRYWSSRIRRETGEALNETFEGGRAPRFAKVQTTKRTPAPSEVALRLVVADVAVEVPAGFDTATLRRVLEVLRPPGGER
jgi:hypothetical protein